MFCTDGKISARINLPLFFTTVENKGKLILTQKLSFNGVKRTLSWRALGWVTEKFIHKIIIIIILYNIYIYIYIYIYKLKLNLWLTAPKGATPVN